MPTASAMRPIDGLEDLGAQRIGTLPPRGHHAADPGHELGRRRHLVAQVGQLEVRVRVDEAGQHGDLAEVDFRRAACDADARARPYAAARRCGRDRRRPSRRGSAARAIGRIQAA